MSSATPAAFLSAISMTTTSASCLSATPRATVAPTFPAPPTTVTLRFICSPVTTINAEPSEPAEKVLALRVQRVCVARDLHILDNRVGERRRLQFRGAVHQAREVVGDALVLDRAVHPLHDQIGRLVPAHVPQHHLAGEDHRPGVDLVLIRILG